MEGYKIMRSMNEVSIHSLFPGERILTLESKGLRLEVKRDLRGNFVTQSAVFHWNELSEEAIELDTIITFKTFRQIYG